MLSAQEKTDEKTLQVNYWKKIRKDFNEVVGRLHGVVLLIHNNVELSQIIDFLNRVREGKNLTLLYISMVNSYRRVKQTLETIPLESKELFMVDCVSGFLIELQDSADCIYRKPPKNLEELKSMILKNIQRTNPNIVVIDSLDQFINFSMPSDEELNELYQFLQSLKQDIWGLQDDAIIILYNDRIGVLQKLPVVSIDEIIKLEVVKGLVKWKD